MFRKGLLVSLILFSFVFPQMAKQCFASAAARFEQATNYYEAGEYEKARELYQYAVDNWPDDPNYAIWAQTLVALSNIDLGNIEAADAAIEKLLTEFSDNEHLVEVVHHIAFHCLTSKRYEKAKQLYQYILDHWPNDDSCAIWSQTGVAMSNISLGETQATEAAIDKLLTDFSDNRHLAEEVHHLAWHCRYQAGNHQKAIQFYQYVLDHWPEDDKYAIWSQSGLALSNIDLGNTEAAQAATDKLLTNFSRNERIAEEVHHIAYHYRELKEYGKAAQLYQYVLDHWPDSNPYAMWSQTGVGVSNAALGNTQVADTAVEKLLSDFSGHPSLAEEVLQVAEPYYNEAFRKEAEGFGSQARDYFQKALAICEVVKNRVPGYVATAETCCWTGASYRALGEYEKSIVCYQKVVDNYPSYHIAWHALFMVGRNYEELGKSAVIPQLEADMKIKTAYQQLLENYPDCKAAKIAQRWLSQHIVETE